MHEGIRQIIAIGDRIAAVTSRRRLDAASFAEVAEAHLLEAGPIESVGLADVVDFLCSPDSPSQSNPAFSDVPLIVYRNRDFHIEVLHWMTTTTSIHAHSFSGAFRVLQGSSIHTPWRIDELEPIERDLALVRPQPIGSEHLQLGAVRRILPDDGGLIHSLFHLEAPSISLVARTAGHHDQFSLYRPRIWINGLTISSSSRVRTIERALRTADSVRRGGGRELLARAARGLDRARWIYLVLTQQRLFESRDALRETLDEHPSIAGELRDAVLDAFDHAGISDRVISSRAAVTDPDLRFFLALLLNVPNRTDLLDIVARRCDGADPLMTCARWIVELARYRGDPAERLARIAASVSVDLRIGVSLGEALAPAAAASDVVTVVAEALAGIQCDDPARGASVASAGEPTAQVRARLAELPVLRSLMA